MSHRSFASAVLAAASLAVLVAPAAALNPMKSLPYVGTLIAVDAAAGRLTVRGPDDTEFTVTTAQKKIISAARGRQGAVEIGALDQHIGKRVGMYLTEPTKARMVCLLDADPVEFNGYAKRVREPQMQVVFSTGGGLVMSVKPAVNLGAVDGPGAKPVRASWSWFEERLDKPFTVETVQLYGTDYIWSVKPWKPEPKKEGKR